MNTTTIPNKIENKKGWALKPITAEWLGQTVASVSWAVSVFFYGLSSTGDWLQLLAASSWFFANMSGIIAHDSHSSGNSDQAGS